MDLEQALGELGVAPGADRVDLKRAYLRAVKAHPPERDPDGFRRVREAYELCSHWTVESYPAAPSNLPAATRADPAAAPPADPAATPPADPAAVPPADPPPADAAAAIPDELPEVASWIEALHAPGVDAARAAEICQQALASAPPSASLVRALAMALTQVNLHEQAAELVVSAYRDGLRELSSDVVWNYPERLSTGELKALASSADPVEQLGAARALHDRGIVIAAAKAMRKLYAAARVSPVAVPAPAVGVETVLLLLGKGRLRSAARLLASLDRWLAVQQLRVDSATSARLALCRDLVALIPRLPDVVLKEIARAVHDGQLRRVGEAVESGELVYDIPVKTRIEVHAPTLYRAIKPFFKADEPAPNFKRRSTHLWPWAMGATVLLRLIYACSHTDEHRHGSAPTGDGRAVVAFESGHE